MRWMDGGREGRDGKRLEMKSDTKEGRKEGGGEECE